MNDNQDQHDLGAKLTKKARPPDTLFFLKSPSSAMLEEAPRARVSINLRWLGLAVSV